jgi:hypothetical protein
MAQPIEARIAADRVERRLCVQEDHLAVSLLDGP